MKKIICLFTIISPLIIISQTNSKTIRQPDFMDSSYFTIKNQSIKDSLFADFIKNDTLGIYTELKKLQPIDNDLSSFLNSTKITYKDSLLLKGIMKDHFRRISKFSSDSLNINQNEKKYITIIDQKIKDSILKEAINKELILPSSIMTSLFCFDEGSNQITNIHSAIESIKSCKFFKHKKQNNNTRNSFWNYDIFKQKVPSEIYAEFNKLNDTIWVLKKFKNNVVISENRIIITDKVVGSSSSYSITSPNGEFKLTKIELLKTKIINN